MAKQSKPAVKKEKKSVRQAQDKPVVKDVEQAKVKAPKKVSAKKEKEIVVPAPSDEKLQVIEEYQVKPGDTGSPEVQVALLSKRIETLISHLKANPSDNHSRRGLLGIVSKRRRLLNYLEKKDKKRYTEIVKKVGLSK